MTSTITFPATHSNRASDISLLSRQTHPTSSALEVCELVYGTDDESSWEALERFYEPGAVYENPLVTVTSRGVLRDIHSLYHQFSQLAIPRPIPLVCQIIRTAIGYPSSSSPSQNAQDFLPIIRTWTEMGEVLENESFDGHRLAIAEHTLNLLVLPGIHDSVSHTRSHSGDEPHSPHHDRSTSNMRVSHVSLASSVSSGIMQPPSPSLPILGTGVAVPSPLHFQLHIITKLLFNEQGRIVHHRDFVDLTNVVGLVPGGYISQWIGSRLAARGLSMAFRLGSWAMGV